MRLNNLIYSLFLLFNGILYSQITQKNLRLIEDNIIVYRLNKLENFENFKISNYFLSKILPDKNQRLYIELNRSLLKFPDTTITLYELRVVPYIYVDSLDSRKYMFNRSLFKDNYAKNYLVGQNNKDNSLLFVSGAFFKNEIKTFFNLKIDEPHSFNEFIKLKLYNYSVNNIEYIKNTRKKIIFKVFSELVNNYIIIKIDKSNFDVFDIYSCNGDKLYY